MMGLGNSSGYIFLAENFASVMFQLELFPRDSSFFVLLTMFSCQCEI